MARTVVFHVGLMKSGTTFLQGRMAANRDLLAEQGVLFPGPLWQRQVRAVRDLIANPGSEDGPWAALVEEVRAHPGTAVMSMEFLGPMRPDRIRHAAESFPDADVRAVLTVRDLGRTVPAMWQETLKNGRDWTWARYLAAIEGFKDAGPPTPRQRRTDPGAAFWRQHAAARIARCWSDVLGPEKVTVVTVPAPGAHPSLLWDRFMPLVDLTDADWAPPPRSNESLGATSTMLIRAVNERANLAGPLSRADRKTYARSTMRFSRQVLAARRGDEPAIGFTVPPWLHERSEAAVARIARSGVHVVGDLAELVPRDVEGVDPAGVDPEVQLTAAADALAWLLRDGAMSRPADTRVAPPTATRP